jgi:hypothetical protein
MNGAISAPSIEKPEKFEGNCKAQNTPIQCDNDKSNFAFHGKKNTIFFQILVYFSAFQFFHFSLFLNVCIFSLL